MPARTYHQGTNVENTNRSSSHAVYNLKLHIVFVTKYRRQTLSPELLAYLETAFGEILAAWRCRLIEFGGETDHVHLLVDIHPALDISVLINNLKTASARRARNRFADHLAPSTANPYSGTAPILSVALGASHWKRCALTSTRRAPRSTPGSRPQRQETNLPPRPPPGRSASPMGSHANRPPQAGECAGHSSYVMPTC
jgi:REP element-mobilizing transposase RayT